ncbi:hypothetical protein IPC1135_30040 [Pseudomonas aeruginosa]|uniref:hypothetical protein n=1 Tax=Pseudomonas aeruginosa TaxID=287 RepID=UPI000FC40DC9|nr:hypothetical protein [Pseudomonas aeruginosa]RUE86406.1 hypothetical protein IPC1135_30040 [Pseudomonas aeruginosa]
MQKQAYQLGVFSFGMVTAGLVAPGLLGDTPVGGVEFLGASVSFITMIFCAYKSVTLPAEPAETADSPRE